MICIPVANVVFRRVTLFNITCPLLDIMFLFMSFKNIIIYILCFIVTMFIGISTMFNIICFGFIGIVYVMCFFAVLFLNNVIMVYIYGWAIFAKRVFFHII